MNPSYGDVFDAVAAAVQPDDPAVFCDEQVVSWGEFDRASNALARALRAAGLQPGAKVAQYMRNSPEYLIGFAAAFKARLAPVNVNYRYGPDELFYLFDNCDAEAVLFDADFGETVQGLKDRLPEVKVWASVGGPVTGFPRIEDLWAGDGSPLGIERSSDDMFLLYTGGTTGLPKGVMWPSGTWWTVLGAGRAPVLGQEPPMTLEALQAQVRAGLGRDPVYVATPLMHGTGLFTSVAAMSKAAPVVLTRKPSFDPRAALDTVTRLRCGGFVIVGDAFARPLLDALRAEPGRYDATCIKTVTSSGMMWSPEVKTGLLEFMPNAMLFDSFGSSEATGLGVSVTTRDAPASEARFEAPQTIVVRESDFTPVTPGSGEVGLVAKHGDLPLGYYKDPEKTARTYVTINGERHLISGDHATVEADGTIRLLGRGNHCINSGGEKIYPEEVEEALKTHPAVLDALVFGVPDPRFGQAISAVVGLVEGARASDTELIEHVRGKLAAYKAPRRIAFAPKAPRAPNGKADYATAKTLFAEAFPG
ncbi:MAG TPA: AMP-binding protein [Caulobacteraceae bacterium]|jgi:fatty-acyl-CoA synthase|nr:AMP-binding protein [Caulobacteraceae bacterium]